MDMITFHGSGEEGNFSPAIITYEITASDLDSENSGRSKETGFMHRDVIRSGIYQVSANVKVPTSQLHSLGVALSGATISVTFFDPILQNDLVTADMYAAADKKAKVIRYREEGDALDETYWDMSFTLIQI